MHAKIPPWWDPSSRLATINMGRKFGGLRSLLGGGAGSPSNIKSPGPRPTSIPSGMMTGILIHPAIWPQQIWDKIGVVPLLFGGGELGPHLTQCGQGWGLPAWQVSSCWSVQPFGHNTPMSQTGQGRQRSDSIGQTVLQTVTQKREIK